MRLIDADALINKAETVLDEHKTIWFDAVSVNNIDSAPTIEIVRCKECKHWWETEGANYGDCNQFKVDTIADDFCSYGEEECQRCCDGHAKECVYDSRRDYEYDKALEQMEREGE